MNGCESLPRARRAPRAIRRISILSLALLAACAGERPRGNAEVELHVDARPAPEAPGPVMLTVTVTDVAWRPLNGARVTVAATPPGAESAGEAAHARGIGAGQYQVPNFALDREGEWLLTVRVELAGGRWAELDTTIGVGVPG